MHMWWFPSFPVVDWFCLFIDLLLLPFPLEDCSVFGNFVFTLISYTSYEWVSDCCLTSGEHIPNHPVFVLTPQSYVLRGEAAHTNIMVFGLTRPGLDRTTYRPQGENANHYITNMV